MMKFVFTFVLLLAPFAATGQGLPANTSAMGCLNSSATIASNNYGVVRCDAQGNLLIGGGAPLVLAPGTSVAIQRTTAIGTSGVQVSPITPDLRRAVANIGTVACELVAGPGSAYGTGYPLPVGGFFSFDAAGRTTAALAVACSAAGGSVSVISY